MILKLHFLLVEEEADLTATVLVEAERAVLILV
jgi:hypothetical protein